MDNLSTTLTVYEKKRIYLTDSELREHGYDGILTDLRSACERAIGQKIRVYSSRINAIAVRPLKSLDAFEVDYYHIHKFDRIYIEDIVYKAYRDTGLKVQKVFVTGDRDILIDVNLITNVTNISSINSMVRLDILKAKLSEYITLNYCVNLNVTIKSQSAFVPDEVLRFNC